MGDPSLEDIEDLLPRGWQDIAPSGGTPSVTSSSMRSVTPTRRSRPSAEVYAKQSTRRGEDVHGDIPGTQTVFLKTQGCSHNVSDGEYMAGLLASYGYSITEEWTDDTDIFVFNSCTVKGPSQDSFLNMVAKARTTGKPVVVAGCVPQGQPDRDELEGVSIVGVQQIHRVVEVVEEAVKGNTVRLLGQRQKPSLDLPKIRRNALVEIVPISTGCLNHCTYCKTKHARGDLGSYEPEALVKRVETVVQEGVREIWLSSEDTGAYGKDIGTNLPTLLNSIVDALPEGVMLRVGMTNPPHILEHMEEVAKVLNNEKVFKFLHIPVQCGSDKVLADMRREYTVADFEKLADYLIEHVPNITIATDIICGFPTEEEEHFQGTMALIQKYKFPILNIAQFYPRPGTPAAKMKKLPTHIVKDRSRAVTSFFETYKTWDWMVGTTQQVWIVEYGKDVNYIVGHSRNYAQVLIPRDSSLLGRSVMAHIDSAEKWCVKATVVKVIEEASVLPKISISRTNVLPTREHIQASETSFPTRRARDNVIARARGSKTEVASPSPPHGLAGEAQGGARQKPAVSVSMLGLFVGLLLVVALLDPVGAFLGLGVTMAFQMSEKRGARTRAIGAQAGASQSEPLREAQSGSGQDASQEAAASGERIKRAWSASRHDSDWVKEGQEGAGEGRQAEKAACGEAECCGGGACGDGNGTGCG
mmetsp:Transcript_64990/g.160014  ORF Transcript_64990/g.160014 Transcript_64990/m.160014 type:complete len:700 (-) Transcript_64990:79-2178(-)